MNKTLNSLPEKNRKNLANLLQAFVSDSLDLFFHAKQAHWNVKGMSFGALHPMFDEIHESAEGWADDLAERAVQFGASPSAEVTATTLPTFPSGPLSGTAAVAALLKSLAHFAGRARQAISYSLQENDQDTADLFIEISRAADKWVWMLEAHLQ